jgi:transcriptional regulator with GAF, ATPase, and Fis domain
MSSAAIWRNDVLASALSSAKAGQASILLREATLDNRLDALRDVAVTLLEAVDSLRTAQPSRDHNIRLQVEVQRFETDLIRTALERTGGNQARAARLLGVKHTTLNAKITRYRIRCDSNAGEAGKVIGDREMAA